MKSNYDILGNHIRLIDTRNRESITDRVLGINIDKFFMPSVANVIGTDLSKYKLITKGKFACNPMHVGRDERLPVALYDEEKPAIVSPAYFMFEVIDNSILKEDYLMMWFRRPEFDRICWLHTDGSVRGGITWDDICRLELPIPPIENQLEIVNSYKAITERIALKQKINDNLEATASAMFKERFSIERANPEWLVGTLQDLYTFQYGKGNNNPDNGGVYPVYGSNGIIGGYDEYNNEDAPVIGHIGINCGSLVFALGKHFVTYNGVMCNVNNPKNKYFGYLTLANSRLQAHVRGSSQPFVSYDMLYEIKAVLPPSEVIEQFEKQVTPLFEQVSSNQREIKHLLELQTIQLARLAN